MAKPAPPKSSSLTAPAKDFAGMKTRLEGLHAAMKANPNFKVKRFEISPPSQVANAPAPLKALAAAFDGATFEWELQGAERTAGAIKFPKVAEVLKSIGTGTHESDSYVLMPGLAHGSIELVSGGEEVLVYDRDSGEVMTAGVDVLSAYDAQIDSLGIRAWELRYYDDLDETEDDDGGDGLFTKQGDLLDAVDRAWAALGLRAP
ncbi:MAG: hypothetical protein ACJ790_11280 [Myxococcaceae bacterium]